MSDAIVGQVIVGLFTLAAAFMGTFTHHLFVHRNRKRAVRQALLTEIDAIMRIIKSRGYREQLALRITTPSTLQANIPDTYRVVYDSQLSDIGILDAADVQKIIRFYMMTLAVVEDFKPGSIFSDPTYATREAFAEALAILDAALEIGHELVGRDP